MTGRVWPRLITYQGDSLRKISMPVGGIGTGCIGFSGRGALINWEIQNRPSLGFAPEICSFLIRSEQKEEPIFAKILEGPLEENLYEGPFGSGAQNHGMPRFRNVTFSSAFPFGEIELQDARCPLDVKVQVFNPLIPTDLENSSYPILIYRCVIKNTSLSDATVSIAGNISNFIRPQDEISNSFLNHNKYLENEDCSAIFMNSEMENVNDENYGNFSMALLNPQSATFRTAWADLTWRDSLLDMWKDFYDDGDLEERTSTSFTPVGSLCDKRVLNPGATEEFTFVLSWYFPNRRAWSIDGEGEQLPGTNIGKYSDLIIGNNYTNRFTSSIDVISQVVPMIPGLERRTLDFVSAIVDTNFPVALLDAALSNLSTLKTQTIFQSSDGKFFGWEGVGYNAGSCFGNCTHVWNYEQTTPFLFGKMAMDMRETEFIYATDVDGFMPFRVTFPLNKLQTWPIAAADGQMGCIVKLYREWSHSGDTKWLEKLWPSAKRALSFAWIPGGWDADQDGIMEGVQHNTMDVEYYGPNPQMGLWYLAALRAAEEMSIELKDFDFARKCRSLYVSGSQWIDENLFNGYFYEHRIEPINKNQPIAKGLRHGTMGAQNTENPELQLGAGCLVDQLVGQFLADVTGLGLLLKEENLATTSKNILKFNLQDNVSDHFNHMRSFALGDEKGLLMATYPFGNRPERPFPYFAEMMTGFEYVAAGNLIYRGNKEEAVEVISNVRDRFSGRARNPFDESECGRHYSRAMIAWGLLLAWTGQSYNAKNGVLTFDPEMFSQKKIIIPWFTGHAWGTASIEEGQVTVLVKEGILNLREIGHSSKRFISKEGGTILKTNDIKIFQH